MKPVLIFEHIETSNPGLFGEFLDERAVPYTKLYPNEGDQIPGAASLNDYSGLCFLGGIESVVDPTPAMIDEKVEEFGWSTLIPELTPALAEWIPQLPSQLVAMQWHSDSFSIPPGATKILSGVHCANQAFVDDNVLGMQFHIEIDLDNIRHWALDLKEKHSPESNSFQSGETIMSMVDENFPVSRDIAWQLYSRWIEFL